MTGEVAIVSGAGTWGIALEAVPAASGVVASRGPERVARALPSAGIEGGWSKAPVQRPRPAGFWQNARRFETGSACRPVACGARVIMPPGPCVPFPGAGGTFPPARRPAARSPSEAAVATRTPSGASARTIGTVGIKCQAARGGAALIRRSRRWRAGPHPARRATFSRKREKGPNKSSFSRKREKDEGRTSLLARAWPMKSISLRTF